MIRSRVGKLGLCAIVLGVMAVSASSAQALSWLILNATQTTATELKAALVMETDSTDLTLSTKEVGIRFVVTCTNTEAIGINLEVGGKLTEGGKIKFTGCEAYETAPLTGALSCHIHSAGQPAGTVLTAEGKGELVLHEIKAGEKEVLVKIEPKTGTTLASFLTEKCVVPETNPVNGKLFLRDCEKAATVHQNRHLIEQGPLTSLFVGADTAEHLETSLSGSVWWRLGAAHLGLHFGAML